MFVSNFVQFSSFDQGIILDELLFRLIGVVEGTGMVFGNAVFSAEVGVAFAFVPIYAELARAGLAPRLVSLKFATSTCTAGSTCFSSAIFCSWPTCGSACFSWLYLSLQLNDRNVLEALRAVEVGRGCPVELVANSTQLFLLIVNFRRLRLGCSRLVVLHYF